LFNSWRFGWAQKRFLQSYLLAAFYFLAFADMTI
jgi:hypothetical protein